MKTARSSVRSAVLAAAAIGAVLLVVLAIVYARREWSAPGTTLHRWWAHRGVERPNIILVTLDTTRADHLGCYGDRSARTPVVDALASKGVLFSQAATPAPLTLPAHASIMTGVYPTQHGVRLNGTTALGESQTTLAETLAARGYQTGAFVGAFVLDGRWGLKQGFGTYDDRFDLRKFKRLDLAAVQRPANEVVDATLAWLKERQRVPFFAWVHLYDAHSPYEPPEPFRTAFAERGPAGLYDGEIAFADAQVGRLLSWLKTAGLDERTVIVVVGDHGEGLGSHGEGTHGFFVYDSSVHVPFIVSTPFESLQGVRVDSQVSLVDVFPTVLALAGIDSTSAVHGRSLLPLMAQPRAHDTLPAGPYAYSESMTPSLQYGWSALRALRSPRYKYIAAPRPELYDLVADPGEATNLFARERRVSGEMARELDRIEAETSRGAAAPDAANLDSDTVRRLASLGYVGGTTRSTNAGAAPGALVDPKDRLDVFTAVQRAGELMAENEHQAAATALESALQQEPGMPQALLMLGSCYNDLGRAADAKAQFDTVLKQDPESVQALVGLANVLLEQGQYDDVVALCRRTLSLDDRNTQAYALLGEAYVNQREPAKALPHFEKAVEIQPKLTQNRLNLAACLIEVHQLDRAKTSLDEVLSSNPRFPGARFNLGVLYEEQGRLAEAQAAYAAELESYPDSFKARFNLGKLKARAEDWPGSIAEMREVIRVAPKRPEGYLFLARALLHGSPPLDEVQALTEKGLALARAPDVQALGWFLMADVYSRRHDAAKVALALRNAQRHASSSDAGPVRP